MRAQVQLLASLNEYKKLQLADALVLMHYKGGQKIIQQGISKGARCVFSSQPRLELGAFSQTRDMCLRFDSPHRREAGRMLKGVCCVL